MSRTRTPEPLKGLQRAIGGVKNPVVRNPRQQINRRLSHAVAAAVTGRHDFANPVGNDGDRLYRGEAGQSFTL